MHRGKRHFTLIMWVLNGQEFSKIRSRNRSREAAEELKKAFTRRLDSDVPRVWQKAQTTRKRRGEVVSSAEC